jgi:His/Glu/Gln/Arg/opine family amino acid ABC transporter permease subunit
MVSFFAQTFPYLAKGAINTLYLSAICLSLGLVIGVLSGVLSVSPNKFIRGVISSYVYLIRGIPLLVLLFLTYYSLPLVGIELNPGIAAAGSISLYCGAFISEIIRGAILSLPAGQTDAAKGLGMRYWLYMRAVIVPQAMRYAIPPIVNIGLMCIKFTALVSIINVWELTYAGKEMSEVTLKPFHVYMEVAFVYFIFCFSLSRLGLFLEKKIHYEH